MRTVALYRRLRLIRCTLAWNFTCVVCAGMCRECAGKVQVGGAWTNLRVARTVHAVSSIYRRLRLIHCTLALSAWNFTCVVCAGKVQVGSARTVHANSSIIPKASLNPLHVGVVRLKLHMRSMCRVIITTGQRHIVGGSVPWPRGQLLNLTAAS